MFGLHLKWNAVVANLRGMGRLVERGAHRFVDDVRGDAAWVGGHVVQPAAHLVSGAVHAIGGAERLVEHEVRNLVADVRSAEHHVVDGAEHAYRWVSQEVKGVGQVLGSVAHRIGDDASAVWSFGERLGRGIDTATRMLPLILGGGALVWVATNQPR